MNLLKTDITSLTGQLKNNYSAIQWQTVNETGKTIYDLEKSTDGIHFTIIGTVRGNAINGIGTYTYKDPEVLSSAAYYRIKVREGSGFKYSKLLLLSPGELHFAIKNIVNPFSGTMQFDVVLPGQGDIKASIYDNYGRIVKVVTQQQAERGITSIKITDLEVISNGIYTLKVAWQQETISKQVIKTGN